MSLGEVERKVLEEICEDINDVVELSFVVGQELGAQDGSPVEVARRAILDLLERGYARVWRGKSPPEDGSILAIDAAAAALSAPEQWISRPRGDGDLWVEATEFGCEHLRGGTL